MQLETLKIFCDVARLRSFSQGAGLNDVSQSRASQAIQQLEQQMGAILIDRSQRPWRLTAEGKAFYDGCREIVGKYYDLEAQIKDRHAQTASVVHVAAIYSVGLGDMSRYVQRFSESNPQGRVQLEYLHPDRVYERVSEEAVDFGIVSFPERRRELTVIPWRTEPMVLVCPPGHRLAAREKVALDELAGEKFVGFDKDLVIRRQIDRLLRRHGVRVDVVMEFDNIEAIKRAVEVGAGIALLPAPTVAREAALGTLLAVPLADEAFARPLGIIHRRGKRFYPNTRQFLELLQSNGAKA
jgi:DNA-binding transcriptional LysR family regulator